MSESIISRLGGLGGDSVSNETKASLGLSNDATLDDVIMMLQYKDENYGSIIVTLENPDGSPVPNSTIQMTDVGGGVLNYTTNTAGKCLFKTQAGQATFSDFGFPGYFDLSKPADITVDCPVGGVYTVNLQRQRKYTNGQNIQITSNGNIYMSEFAKNANVCISGGGGSSGRPSEALISGNISGTYIYNFSYTFNNTKQQGGLGGNGYTNSNLIEFGNTNYSCIIGAGGWVTENQMEISGVGYLYEIGGGNSTSFSKTTYGRPGCNGATGGTTSFGGILSAKGGAGGINSTKVRSAGGDGAGGGNWGWIKFIRSNSTTYGTEDEGDATMINAIINFCCNSGQPGYIWLNNFQYK